MSSRLIRAVSLAFRAVGQLFSSHITGSMGLGARVSLVILRLVPCSTTTTLIHVLGILTVRSSLESTSSTSQVDGRSYKVSIVSSLHVIVYSSFLYLSGCFQQ